MEFNLSSQYTPSSDFYSYVNHNWISTNSIPDDHQRWSVFNILNDENTQRINDMIKNYKGDNILFNKVNILYHQCFINQDNTMSPREIVGTFLDDMDNVNTKEELATLLHNYFTVYGLSPVVGFCVYNDYNDSNNYIVHVVNSGLGLPDRDYYFDDSKEEIRGKYKEFMVNYMKLFDIDIDVSTIYNLEETFAKSTLTKVEKRNPHLRNNVFTFEKFTETYPDTSIDMFFKMVGVEPGTINVMNPKFLKNTDNIGYYDLWNSLPLNVWKQYYTWTYCRKVGNILTKSTEEMIFDFYSRTLSGTPIMRPLWKRCVDRVEGSMGMAVGMMFVDKFFSEESKETVIKMINYIKNEIRQSIESNTWMDRVTKDKALMKLDKMNYKIGYPDKWQNMDAIDVSGTNSYFTNVMNCNKFESDYDNSFLYKTKDTNLWFMNPQDVNAYYSPSYNEIVFPAGILMKPFFSLDYDMASNFGAIGAVIGHEMTHGFDDEGRKFDMDGNLVDWWTEKDAERYKTETDKLRKLFSDFVIEGHNVNGDLTLGENIADLGGLSISLKAYMKYLEDNPSENVVINDHTPQQRFFMSYANLWKCMTRKEETIKRITTDPHSPPCFRVNGILINMDSFYKSFDINEGDDMWLEPSLRTNIW